MAQNAISGKLKLRGEYISRLPAFGNYRILKLHGSIQDTFSLPVLTTFRHLWLQLTFKCTMGKLVFLEILFINCPIISKLI